MDKAISTAVAVVENYDSNKTISFLLVCVVLVLLALVWKVVGVLLTGTQLPKRRR